MRKRFRKLTAVILVFVILFTMVIMVSPCVEATSAVIENALSWALDIANDDRHGYVLGASHGSEGMHYDCSSFVSWALIHAGIDVPVSTTFYMKENFEPYGFEWIDWSRIGGVQNLERGDILLDIDKHVEFYYGNNQILGAHRPATGISVSNYYNNVNGVSWDGILRYKDEPVKNAWLNINRSELFTGESINFSFGAENSNGSFTIGIDRYGTRVDTINVQGNSYDYTFYQDGDYSAYVTAHGGGTYCDSNRVYFRVTRRWYDNLESADLGYSFLARIEHKASGISFADINGNVQGMVPSTDSSQIWAFTRLSNGAYKIRNVASNGLLDVQGSGPDDNTNVITHWNDTGGSNQQFFIYFLDNGYYIKPSYTDKVLDMMEIENYNVTIWAKGDYHSPQLFNINTISVGDTNLDGNINIRDVTAIQRHLAEVSLFTDEQLALADTNGDGKVDVADATHLQKYLAGYKGIVLGKS